MKKNVYIIPLFILAVFLLSGCEQLSLVSDFTPVFCNDYEFTCCQEIKSATSYSVSPTLVFKCPDSAVKCVIDNAQANVAFTQDSRTYIYYGKTNCRVVSGFLGIGTRNVCDDEKVTGFITGAVGISVPSGYEIWTDRASTLAITTVRQRLAFTGRAASGTGGVLIKSDSCAFTVSKGIIEGTGGQNLGTSYTVPMTECVLSWQSGDRHICGYLEEKCSSDSDCGGHTFGNKECYARTLQTYGCRQLSLPNGVAVVNGEYRYTGYDNIEEKNAFSGVSSRCEIISSANVQCCGDSDCGSNFVCDKNTFTCKPASQVECRYNYDCGTSTQCDYTTTTLKKPICSSGTCGYSEKDVECCNDNNCASNYYCGSDYKCLERTVITKECPFQCCVGLKGYTDKACSTDEFCVNNACQSTPGCRSDDDCNLNQKCSEGECVDKEMVCDPETKFFGLVTGTVKESSSCGFLGASCWFGSPKKEVGCVYDWSPFWLLLGLLFLIGLITMGIILAVGYAKKKMND